MYYSKGKGNNKYILQDRNKIRFSRSPPPCNGCFNFPRTTRISVTWLLGCHCRQWHSCYTSTKLHGVISQKTTIWIFRARKTSKVYTKFRWNTLLPVLWSTEQNQWYSLFRYFRPMQEGPMYGKMIMKDKIWRRGRHLFWDTVPTFALTDGQNLSGWTVPRRRGQVPACAAAVQNLPARSEVPPTQRPWLTKYDTNISQHFHVSLLSTLNKNDI